MASNAFGLFCVILCFILVENSSGQYQTYGTVGNVGIPEAEPELTILKSQEVAHWDVRAPTREDILQQDFLKLFDFNRNPEQNIYRVNGAGQCSAPLPNLGQVSHSCARKDFFFGMNPKHMEAIGQLTQIISAPNSAEDVICTAAELRDRPEVNPNVWFNSLMNTVVNRRDLDGLRMPPLVEIMPSKFINSEVLRRARQMSVHRVRNPNRNQQCVILDGRLGVDNGIENELWYWREDIMLNANHWYWHLVNPFVPVPVNGRTPPRPDRRGELFFYFHHSILARYNAERLANNLPKLQQLFLKQGEVIDEPYYAHFDGTFTGQRWGDRPANTPVQDIYFNSVPDTPVNITLFQHNEQLRRINEAVQSGSILTANGGSISLLDRNGIDVLAEAVEASVYSVNRQYYGEFGVHNEGHFFLGLAHDPQGRLGASPGIMTDASTAMRDPAFYRYHTPVAAIFHDHKDTLPPHLPTGGEYPLHWQGVSLTDARIVSERRGPNDLTTFFNEFTFDISRGLDFNRSVLQGQGPVFVCARHLDHEPFTYQITLEKDPSVRSNVASVRIFMAPKFDENGRPFPLGFQRFRFFPMDYFQVRINPGTNYITRRSLDSSLTVSWPQRLDNLERDTNLQMPNCGCGWPHHLLVPKGNRQGMIYDMFYMVTNGDEDAVPNVPGSTPPNCRAAPIFCGIAGQLYPDSKPMGYPFDRLPYSVQDGFGRQRQVQTIDEYVRGISNMGHTQVRITHLEGRG